MKKFKFEKLVRDKVLEGMLSDKTQNPKYRILDNNELVVELKKKLVEETSELLKANNEEMLGELADIQELIDNLIRLLGESEESLYEKVQQKLDKAGGFSKKAYIEYNEVSDDSSWVEEYKKQPEKYPEID